MLWCRICTQTREETRDGRAEDPRRAGRARREHPRWKRAHRGCGCRRRLCRQRGRRLCGAAPRDRRRYRRARLQRAGRTRLVGAHARRAGARARGSRNPRRGAGRDRRQREQRQNLGPGAASGRVVSRRGARGAHPEEGARPCAQAGVGQLAGAGAGLHGRGPVHRHRADRRAGRPHLARTRGHLVRVAAALGFAGGALREARVHLPQLQPHAAGLSGGEVPRRAMRLQGDQRPRRRRAVAAGRRRRVVLRHGAARLGRTRGAAHARVSRALDRGCGLDGEDRRHRAQGPGRHAAPEARGAHGCGHGARRGCGLCRRRVAHRRPHSHSRRGRGGGFRGRGLCDARICAGRCRCGLDLCCGARCGARCCGGDNRAGVARGKPAHPQTRQARLGGLHRAHGRRLRRLLLEPDGLRLCQRVLQRRRAGRLPGLGGLLLGLARCGQRHYRGQAARLHLAHGAVRAPVRAVLVCHTSASGAHGRRDHLAPLRDRAPLLGQLGGHRGRRGVCHHARGRADVSLQQPRRAARLFAGRGQRRRAARAREACGPRRRQAPHGMVRPRRPVHRICLFDQAAPGLPRAARFRARDVRVLACAGLAPPGRRRRRAGRHGRRRGMVGARGRARAQRLAPLLRRLADRLLPRADLLLQRARAPDGRRDGLCGRGRRWRAGRRGRRHVGRDRAVAPLRQ